MRGRNEEAWRILQKIHHDPRDAAQSAAKAEFIQITKQVELLAHQKTGYIQMFTKPSWRRRSILVLFLLFATQSTGILGIGAYSIIIYQSLGLTGSLPLLMYCIYVIVGTVANFMGTAIMDKVGRRKMFREYT